MLFTISSGIYRITLVRTQGGWNTTPCIKQHMRMYRDLYEWKDFYPNAQEMMTRHMPEALGNYVVIKAYVDANHAGNVENGRSHSGIIIYVNNAPVIWYSKQHNTVES